MKRRFTRAQRAKLRKPFPSSAPDTSAMDFPTLVAWEEECGRQAIVTSAWTLSGFRWRRARHRAHREWFTRLTTHVGPAPGLCDYCQTRPALTHSASGPREAPQFEHTCDECAPLAPVGWMSVAFARVDKSSIRGTRP